MMVRGIKHGPATFSYGMYVVGSLSTKVFFVDQDKMYRDTRKAIF